MKKTIAIGDIHGLKNWKKIVEEHPTDKIVFLGDYCDPYVQISNFDLLSNMLDIIELKQKRKDDIILLLGNHDMHYIYEDFPVSTRYNQDIARLLQALFKDERKLFQFAYQDGNTLFTHAGVSNLWWDKYFKGNTNEGAPSIADQLNNPTEEQMKAMFLVGYGRGGNCECGSIFWADLDETCHDSLLGVHQIVGHTQVEHMRTVSSSEETSITYCDCLCHGKFCS
ncbi:MAG: metallophosphoesterase [Bacteroidaceae bacterium]|nr:metallophosphoesterase [Bacteroidaceae bacterium]